jgi:hypothetical protein
MSCLLNLSLRSKYRFKNICELCKSIQELCNTSICKHPHLYILNINSHLDRNKMKLLKGIQLFGLLSVLFVAGCKKDEDPAPVDPGISTTPTVSSISPASSATGISRNKVITVTFSEAMDSSTIVNASTFTLKQGTFTREPPLLLLQRLHC